MTKDFELTVHDCFRLAELGMAVTLRFQNTLTLPDHLIQAMNSASVKRLRCSGGVFTISRWEVSKVLAFREAFQTLALLIEPEPMEPPCHAGEPASIQIDIA